MNETVPEPEELSNWQKSQVALQLVETIERVAAIARENGFPAVAVMLEMTRDLVVAFRHLSPLSRE
jgi:hypothetical protein